MHADPACPTCAERQWRSYGKRSYERGSVDVEKGWPKTALTILFEEWVQGEDTFVADFIGCGRCGLMIYRPRPSEADITAKYRFIGGMGDATPSKGEDAARTRQRANRIARILRAYLPESNGSILDYGGGDGRLLKAFVDSGRPCHLIDYADRPIQGVDKVGDTENDLALNARYAAIVCSHVVEHLPEPVRALTALGRALDPDGVMYVEVPYETYGSLPARREPVTHVNFFNPASMRALLEASGLEVIRSGPTMYPHPNGGWAMAVGALARRARKPRSPEWPGRALLDQSIKPSVTRKVWFKVFGKIGKLQSQLRDR